MCYGLCFCFYFFFSAMSYTTKKAPFSSPYHSESMSSFHFRAINMICAPCKRVTGKKMINGFMPLKNWYKSNNVFSWNASVYMVAVTTSVQCACGMHVNWLLIQLLSSSWIPYIQVKSPVFSHHSKTNKKLMHTRLLKNPFFLVFLS